MRKIYWVVIVLILMFVGGGILLSVNSISIPRVSPIRSIMLPNTGNNTNASGFTCTGLSFSKGDNKWYVGNVGARNIDSEFFSSIEILDRDFKQIERRIVLASKFPKMRDVQGIEVDSVNRTIWLCSFYENKVRHIDFDGNDLGELDVDHPNGIAFEQTTQHLYVLTRDQLIELDTGGNIISSTAVRIDDQDQIVRHGRYIFITSGGNYKRDQYLHIFDLEKKKVVQTVRLLKSYAVEGIEVIGDSIFVANDGEYHSSKDGKNVVNVYSLREVLSTITNN